MWPWELVSDGVEMQNVVPHGTQVFVFRCAVVPEDLLCKARNVKPAILIPGPVAPKNFARYWRLILDLFAGASPLCGALLCKEQLDNVCSFVLRLMQTGKPFQVAKGPVY